MDKKSISETDRGVVVAEYERLKDEQRQRISVRDNLIYATLASMTVVIAAALNAKGHANLLLLLPPVCIVLGWTYLVNDQKISAIGRYVREEIKPVLEVGSSVPSLILAWEQYHRSDSRRRSRKYLQLAVDLSTFCLPALAAIVIFFVNGPLRVGFVVTAVVELVSVAILALQITFYLDHAVSPMGDARVLAKLAPRSATGPESADGPKG